MKKKTGGFTLIELMIVVAIIGILSAVAIPAFIKYIRKSKTVEATEALDKVKIGAREYFVVDHWSSGGTLIVKQFPTAVTAVPGSPCCTKCTNVSANWDDNGWDTLKFGLTEPHYYSYAFKGNGTTNAARYTATAKGDLDCDNTQSTFEIRGSVDGEGAVVTVGPIITDEIE